MSDTINNPHDKFFKESFSRPEVARDFLRQSLPAEVVALLDLEKMTLLKASFVDEALQEHFSDLLYQVALPNGQPAFIYVLFEHKSYPDPLVALQVLRYMVKIWDHTLRTTGRLSPILPVVLYHGTTNWHTPAHFQDLFPLPEPLKPYMPEFRYYLCDLSQYNDHELQGAAMMQVGVLMLKYILREELPARLPEIVKLLQVLSTQQSGLTYVEAVLRYLISAASSTLNEQIIEATIIETFEAGGDIMGTLAQQWLEKGKQQGLQEGLQQGLKEGEQRGQQIGMQHGLLLKAREALFTVLGLRFGDLPVDLVQTISTLEDTTRLTELHKTAIVVTSLDEFVTQLSL